MLIYPPRLYTPIGIACEIFSPIVFEIFPKVASSLRNVRQKLISIGPSHRLYIYIISTRYAHWNKKQLVKNALGAVRDLYTYTYSSASDYPRSSAGVNKAVDRVYCTWHTRRHFAVIYMYTIYIWFIGVIYYSYCYRIKIIRSDRYRRDRVLNELSI